MIETHRKEDHPNQGTHSDNQNLKKQKNGTHVPRHKETIFASSVGVLALMDRFQMVVKEAFATPAKSQIVFVDGPPFIKTLAMDPFA